MNNPCLVTKLRASVANDNLLKPGEIKINAMATGSDKKVSLNYKLGDPVLGVVVTTKCSVPTTFINGANNTVLVENATEYTGAVSNVDVVLPNGVPATVTVTDKYKLRVLNLRNFNAKVIGFDFLPSLDQLYVQQSDGEYDVTGINLASFRESDMTIINSAALISGDISALADKTRLTILSIGTYMGNRINNITGDVSSLSALVNLTQLGIRDTYLTGNMDLVLNAYAASGRTSDLALSIDVNRIQMTDKKAASSNHVIRFNSGMQNPTEAETARGWQVA